MFTKVPTITPGQKSTEIRRRGAITRPRPDSAIAGILRVVRRSCADDDGVWLLYRLPSEDERAALVRRQAALEIAATPALPHESAVAVVQMFSGFPSYRAGEADAEMMATQYATVLRKYPAWAIRAACDEISSGRLVGDEALNLNPAFPPSAEQVAIVTAREVRALERELVEVREVLTGRVEDHHPRPTKEEIEAKLGRAIGTKPAPAALPPDRAKVLKADLAERRARNEELAKQQPQQAAE